MFACKYKADIRMIQSGINLTLQAMNFAGGSGGSVSLEMIA